MNNWNSPVRIWKSLTALFSIIVFVALPAFGAPEWEFHDKLPNPNETILITGEVLEKSSNTFKIAEVNEPGIESNTFMVTGEVRTRGFNPNSTSYLEMWTSLPAEPGSKQIASSFFSRTLGKVGVMKTLDATDIEWRKFVLPATMGEDPRRPLQLTLNAILPQITSEESIEIRNLKLIDDASEFFGSNAPPLKKFHLTSFSLFTLILGGAIAGALLTILVSKTRSKMISSELNRIKAVDSID